MRSLVESLTANFCTVGANRWLDRLWLIRVPPQLGLVSQNSGLVIIVSYNHMATAKKLLINFINIS